MCVVAKLGTELLEMAETALISMNVMNLELAVINVKIQLVLLNAHVLVVMFKTECWQIDVKPLV